MRARRMAIRALACLLIGAVLPASPALAVPWRDVRLQPVTMPVAGTTIAYAEIGAAEAPPLIMLNGTASPMSEWDPALIGALADQHRVIVLDYPGLGGSGPPPGRWTFDNGARWVSSFIDAISPGQPVDVLGWSMGGFVAQRLAVQHPEQIHRLILAGTNPGGESAVLGPEWVQKADGEGSVSGYLRSNYPPGMRGLGQAFVDRIDAAVASGNYPDASVPAATAEAMVRAEDPWLRSNRNTRQLARIVAPTLVVTGARDLVTPPVNSRRMAYRIPHVTLILVPNAGHSFLFQDPEATAAIFTDFLRQGP